MSEFTRNPLASDQSAGWRGAAQIAARMEVAVFSDVADYAVAS